MKILLAFEEWVQHLWGTKGVQDAVKITTDAGATVLKSALTAGAMAAVSAKAGGGDKDAVEHAALSAALGSAQSVGASVSLQAATAIVSQISDSLHPPAQAPAPPA